MPSVGRLLDANLSESNTPISPTFYQAINRPLPRSAPASFARSSLDEVSVSGSSGASLPQSGSRPNSRRSSRIFAKDGATREDNESDPKAVSDGGHEKDTLRSRVEKTKDSIEGSWGVSSIGRGFDWKWSESVEHLQSPVQSQGLWPLTRPQSLSVENSANNSQNGSTASLHIVPILTQSPLQSPIITRPSSPTLSTSSPRSLYRRRSSQKRISLIAGRLSYTPPPSPPPDPALHIGMPPKLLRLKSTSSFMTVNSTITGPPTPASGAHDYLGHKDIGEFIIQADVGRGAYGLVKRGREIMSDGSHGPEVIIKQVIKSRILADCWKKHPTHGTIPIEIYVMLALSSASYVLPPKRPWDPFRKISPNDPPPSEDVVWEEGKIVNGHPNICPLIDFFEDRNYYYLILPSTLPPIDSAEQLPKDLFDLVEHHPTGLPAHLIRSYLGQIADAMDFLHNRGIVHRDIKDENVVLQLGPAGHISKCWLIDFGSAGIVRKSGWNSFSGTLDYASPEILRGEFYTGKEQDVWAFGVVAYVLLVGECPFATATDAQAGIEEGNAAWEGLEARCGRGHEREGEEEDGGGVLEDAAALVRACLQVEIERRPTFEEVMKSRFLVGRGGWGQENWPRAPGETNAN